MVAQDFLNYISKFDVVSKTGIDDFADRYNYVYTVIVLVLCIAIVSMKQYFMDPINCYVATSFGGKGLDKYIDNFCWVQGTYSLPVKDDLPSTTEAWREAEDKKIMYYQWVPFVLAIQVILFYIPRIVWQMFTYNRTGTDLEFLVQVGKEASRTPMGERKEKIEHVAKILEEMVFKHRDFRKGRAAALRQKAPCLCVGKRLGNIVCFMYLCMKLLFLANNVAQIIIMEHFLGFRKKYSFFGVEILRDIALGRDWEQTLVFPRITFCPTNVKHLGTNNKLIAQCALPVNMLNEKIYIFLWFWIAGGALFTAISILVWLFRMSVTRNQTSFVRRYLRITSDFRKSERALVDKFIHNFLRKDGVFLLKIMAMNVGDLVVSEVITALWHIFKDSYKDKDLGHDQYNDDDDDQLMPNGSFPLASGEPDAPPADEEKA